MYMRISIQNYFKSILIDINLIFRRTINMRYMIYLIVLIDICLFPDISYTCINPLVKNSMKNSDGQYNLFATVPDEMGFAVENVNLTNLTEGDITTIKTALIKHSVIVIKKQKLTRKQQLDLTKKLGKFMPLPKFLALTDTEDGFEDKILRVTNYDSSGNLKSRQESMGQFWHKDGDYFENDYIGTMLYADKITSTETSRPTLFLHNCKSMKIYPKDLLKQVENVANKVDLSLIEGFLLTGEDRKEFPPVFHKLAFKHPANGKNCIYLTDHMTTGGQVSEKDKQVMKELWSIMVEQTPKYQHNWEEGDVVIWDNVAVMHRTGFIDSNVPMNTGMRMLYRTQYLISTFEN